MLDASPKYMYWLPVFDLLPSGNNTEKLCTEEREAQYQILKNLLSDP